MPSTSFGRREMGTPFSGSTPKKHLPKMISPFGSSYIVHRKRGGRVPGYDLGGLFGGSSGSQSNWYQQSSTGVTNNNIASPGYNNLMESIFGKASGLLGANASDYIAAFSPDQLQAFGDIRANQGNWSPFYGNALASLGNVSGMNPFTSGMPFINQAAGMQTGTDAAGTALKNASGTFTGSNVGQYMNPYIKNVIEANNRLSNQNLRENVLPGINDTFTGGAAAQFGRERHADITGRAIRDNQQTLNNTNANALASGFNTSANIFQNDMSRLAGIGGLRGTLAQTDLAQKMGLGTAAGQLAGMGVNAGINLGNAYQGLGTATQTASGKDAAALFGSGQAQQAQQQNVMSFPLQMMNFLKGIGQGWQLPTNSNFTNSAQGISQSSGSPGGGSPFGQVLGGLLGLGSLAIPGAGGVSALGNIFGSLFGGAGGAGPSGTTQSVPQLPTARGGQIKRRAAGGMIPAVRTMRGLGMNKNGQPMGGQNAMMPPTGMPGMPPMAPPMPRPVGAGMPAGFASGGSVGTPEGLALRSAQGYFAEGGDVLHGILGGIGGLVGNLIPIPVVGPMIGRLAGHELSNLVQGRFGNMDDDLVQDAASPLPFGGNISNAILRGDPSRGAEPGPGDYIEKGFGMFGPFMGRFGFNAKGGDVKQDKRMVTKAVHAHERNMHRGKPVTELHLAEGGIYRTGDPLIDESVFLKSQLPYRNPDAPGIFRGDYGSSAPPSPRDRMLRDDPAEWLWRHLAPKPRAVWGDVGGELREWLPDRSAAGAVEASGDIMDDLRDRDYFKALSDSAVMGLNLMGIGPVAAGPRRVMRAVR